MGSKVLEKNFSKALALNIFYNGKGDAVNWKRSEKKNLLNTALK